MKTNHDEKILRLMNNHLHRTKRQLSKLKEIPNSDVKEMEDKVNEIKEKIKLYKHKINTR